MIFHSITAVPALIAADRLRGRQQVVLGSLYWLTILLLLEPGNIGRAVMAGYALRPDQECIRILGASLLGGLATPVLFMQMRRFPIRAGDWAKNALIQAAGIMLLSVAMITASCVLAEMILVRKALPIPAAILHELNYNWALLVICLASLAVGLEWVRATIGRDASTTVETRFLAEIAVRGRGTTIFVKVDDVDWLEAQGNYVALHVGAHTHLVRESLAQLEARLDPNRFLRIHRGAIVQLERISSVTAAGAGDAVIRLRNATEIRASRTYRAKVDALRGRSAF